MELGDLIAGGIESAKSEPIIAIIIVGIIAILFYFRTKTMLKLSAIFLVIALLIYALSLFGVLTSSGVSQKENLIEKSQQ